MIVVALLAVVTLIALLLQVVSVVKTREAERNERLRIELETHRAEYRLHLLASDAFAALLDETRSRYRHDEPS